MVLILDPPILGLLAQELILIPDYIIDQKLSARAPMDTVISIALFEHSPIYQSTTKQQFNYYNKHVTFISPCPSAQQA